MATILRSHSVVVGDFKFKVSDKIADSNIPPIFLGKYLLYIKNECAIIADMHPHGRMSTNIGFSVTIVFDCNA
jgi:hypothetical protein